MKIVLLESLGIPESLLCQLTSPLTAEGHSFTAYQRAASEEELRSQCMDADILMLANRPLPAGVISSCSHLRYIDIAFTGTDHVAVDTAKKQGIQLSNAAGYATNAVAELTLSQMIALLRNTVKVEDRARHGGTKNGLVGRELSGCKVGIIGTGAIGQRVAGLCLAFGAKVVGYAPRPKENAKALLTYVSLEELLRTSDIVSLHCPLTQETRGMIGKAQLALMKPDAYLINMARGPVVDSTALAEALNQGQIAGAAIDVFDQEPPLPEGEPLLHAQNCLVTPHIGFASAESMALRAQIVFENLYAWLRGELRNPV